jgi:5'-nucleotidase
LLPILVRALKEHFDVRVVVPDGERSWIGKALTRWGNLKVHPTDVFDCPAWVVQGTPADCVNLGLCHLLAGEKVDAVISGINIGYNVTLPLVLSSGTVGAALEGALWGLPSLALSQAFESSEFELLQGENVRLGDPLLARMSLAASFAPDFVSMAMREHRGRIQVHNWNFPISLSTFSPVTDVSTEVMVRSRVHRELEDLPGTYVFGYQSGQKVGEATKTDLNCLMQGHITHALLDYSSLSASGDF